MNVEPRRGSRKWEKLGPFRKSSRPEAGSPRTPHQLPTAANPGALWVKSPPPPTSSHPSPTLGQMLPDRSFSLSRSLPLLPVDRHSELPGWNWVSTCGLPPSSFSPEGTGVTSVAVSRRWSAAKASESSGRYGFYAPHHWRWRSSSTCLQPLWRKWTTYKKLQFVFPRFLRTLRKKVCVSLLP